ncbi:dnaJ homolog subfamily C member 24 isoform X2 [Polypterus senegalus]|uniref:dnaJ homolog subfamily C member 24 isoform X2 n=1 Tax=Polypterus senegalus TaxID=55291 RepID=UPI0019647492|nr:dnaJ homolog subfamily C member 24 isoform X2 [Polypterus senegalus]
MTPENIFSKDWYKILDASPSSNLQELKQQYQKMILLYHPDKQSPDVPSGEAEQRVQRFIEVDQAWKILGNEETKKAYDLQRHAAELKQSWPVDACISVEDMTWDNDLQSYVFECRCGGEYHLYNDEIEENDTVICCNTCSLSIEVQQNT